MQPLLVSKTVTVSISKISVYKLKTIQTLYKFVTRSQVAAGSVLASGAQPPASVMNFSSRDTDRQTGMEAAHCLKIVNVHTH